MSKENEGLTEQEQFEKDMEDLDFNISEEDHNNNIENGLYKMQLNDAKAADTNHYVQRLELQMERARELYIAGEIHQATKIAHDIGSNPESYPDPFYDFEGDLRNSYYDGAAQRKAITAEHTKQKLSTAYTLKNDKKANSFQVKTYRSLKDNQADNLDYAEFGARFLALKTLADQTKEPALKKALYQQISDTSFKQFLNNPKNTELFNNVNKIIEENIANQGLEITEEAKLEQVMVLLSKESDTPKKLQNMELAFNEIYSKDRVIPEVSLQQQKANEIKNSIEDSANPIVTPQPEQEVEPTITPEATIEPKPEVLDTQYNADILNGAPDLLKRQMELTLFMQKTNDDYKVGLVENHNAKITANEEYKAEIKEIKAKKVDKNIKAYLLSELKEKHQEKMDKLNDFKDSTFKIEKGLEAQYDIDLKEKHRLEAIKNPTKEELQELISKKFWLDGGKEQYFAQKYLMDDKLYSKIENIYPEIKQDVEKRIEEAKDPSIQHKSDQNIDATITAFANQHGIKDVATIKNQFKNASKQDLKDAGKLALKGLSLGLNPAGFVIGQTMKAIMATPAFKTFRQNFSERISNGLNHLKSKSENGESSKLYTMAKVTVGLLTGAGMAAYAITAGEITPEQLEALAQVTKETIVGENTVVKDTLKGLTDQIDIVEKELLEKEFKGLDIQHGSFKEGLDKFLAMGDQQFSTSAFDKEVLEAANPLEEPIDYKNLTLQQELDLVLGANPESNTYNPNLQEKYQEVLAQAENTTPVETNIQEEIVEPEPIVEPSTLSGLAVTSYENQELVSNIMKNEFPMDKFNESIELLESKGIRLDEEDTINLVKNNILSQLKDGTFPATIELEFKDLGSELTITKEQLLSQQQFLEMPIYEVARGDTLSEIAEKMAIEKYGEGNVTDSMTLEITDKLFVNNPELKTHNFINAGTELKLINLDALDLYPSSEPNPEIKSFTDIVNGTTKIVMLPDTNVKLMANEIANAAVSNGSIEQVDKNNMVLALEKHMQKQEMFSTLELDKEASTMVADINHDRRLATAQVEAMAGEKLTTEEKQNLWKKKKLS